MRFYFLFFNSENRIENVFQKNANLTSPFRVDGLGEDPMKEIGFEKKKIKKFLLKHLLDSSKLRQFIGITSKVIPQLLMELADLKWVGKNFPTKIFFISKFDFSMNCDQYMILCFITSFLFGNRMKSKSVQIGCCPRVAIVKITCIPSCPFAWGMINDSKDHSDIL
jgi:hypothetical protein